MEAIIKLNIIDFREEDWQFEEYDNCKFQDLSDESLKEVIYEIIRESIFDNIVYCDFNDAEDAMQEIFPIISSFILNPRFRNIKRDYNSLVELVTYLTVRLA